MISRFLIGFVVILAVVGCSGTVPAPSEPAQDQGESSSVSHEEEPLVENGPSEEELARELALERLEEDRAKMRGQAQIELRRWTPELRQRAQELAEREYATVGEGVSAAVASSHRVPGNENRDPMRHPLETLEFFKMTPTMTVLEYGPGEGWYTELLAPVLAARGKLLVTSADPGGPVEDRATYYGERTKLFLKKSPEIYGKVETVLIDGDRPELPQKEQLDLVLVIRGMHGMVNADNLDEWLKQIHKGLKPNGLLGVVQHRAPEGAEPKDSAKKGYLPEAWLITQIEKAGFKMEEKSEINANPKDTKDHPEGVWTLPPTLRLGEQDRQKYVDIGESDRMTLRFIKVDS